MISQALMPPAPAPAFHMHMRAGKLPKPPELKSCDDSVCSRKFDVRYQRVRSDYPRFDLLELSRLSYCCVLPDVWMIGSARAWTGISDEEGGETMVSSSSAAIRQDSKSGISIPHGPCSRS